MYRRHKRQYFYHPRNPYLRRIIPPSENKELSPNQMKQYLLRGGYLKHEQEPEPGPDPPDPPVCPVIEPLDIMLTDPIFPIKYTPEYFDGKVTNDITIDYVPDSNICFSLKSYYNVTYYAPQKTSESHTFDPGSYLIISFIYSEKKRKTRIILQFFKSTQEIDYAQQKYSSFLIFTLDDSRKQYPLFFTKEPKAFYDDGIFSVLPSIEIPTRYDHIVNTSILYELYSIYGTVNGNVYDFDPSNSISAFHLYETPLTFFY